MLGNFGNSKGTFYKSVECCSASRIVISPSQLKKNLLSSVQETAIGLGMFSLAILGPSGWILAHLEDYKKRE